jgi:hypothetical protein
MPEIKIEYHYKNTPIDNETLLDELNDHAIQYIADKMIRGYTGGELSYFDTTTDTEYNGWFSVLYLTD